MNLNGTLYYRALFRYPCCSDQGISDWPSLSESESARGGIRTRIWWWSLWTTSCSFPLDLSMSFPASCRERFSVTVPLICNRKHTHTNIETHTHTHSQRPWELSLRWKPDELFSIFLVLSHHNKGCGSVQSLIFSLAYTVITASSSKHDVIKVLCETFTLPEHTSHKFHVGQLALNLHYKTFRASDILTKALPPPLLFCDVTSNSDIITDIWGNTFKREFLSLFHWFGSI